MLTFGVDFAQVKPIADAPPPSPPLPSEYGTHKTVNARFWPWLSGKSPSNLLRCSLFDQVKPIAENTAAAHDQHYELPVRVWGLGSGV